MEHTHVMERGDCLHFLGQSSIGRIAFTAGALPAIRPLPYALDGEDVLVSTRSSSLAQRLHGQVVAFAVDEAATATALGWSVVVTGLAHLLPQEHLVAQHLAAEGFTSGPGPLRVHQQDEHLVRIAPGMITGRWLDTLNRDLPPGVRATSGAYPRPEHC
jgi:nitroimidazol reductase NimA-like FMN-containing flavoprotein (pyridoxamine 5'-phosphate oxidase superfamily)